MSIKSEVGAADILGRAILIIQASPEEKIGLWKLPVAHEEEGISNSAHELILKQPRDNFIEFCCLLGEIYWLT